MRIHIAFWSLLVLISCEKMIDVPHYKQFEPYLVLNGYIDISKGVYVEVSQALNPSEIYESTEIYIDNAKVWIEVQDSTIHLSHRDSGVYLLSENIVLESGLIYKIICNAPGFGKVWSEVMIPDNIDDFTYDFKETTNLLISDRPILKLNISFRDTVRDLGHYQFITRGDDELFSLPSGDYFLWDAMIGQCGLTQVPNRSWMHVFDSSCKKGDQIDLTFYVYLTSFSGDEEVKDFVECDLNIIESAYRDYLLSNDPIDGIDLFFSEPQFSKSNVNNGGGIIIASNSRKWRIYR